MSVRDSTTIGIQEGILLLTLYYSLYLTAMLSSLEKTLLYHLAYSLFNYDFSFISFSLSFLFFSLLCFSSFVVLIYMYVVIK